MKIGIVLASSPGYSETFFTSKIKGLQENGIEVILFVSNIDKNFTLCSVEKSPKVYKQFLLKIIAMLFQFIKLIPHLKSLKRYIQLERKQKTSFPEILKKVYLNSHVLTQKIDWLHFGFATQALGSELVAKAIGAKMAVSFRGFDINVYPVKHSNCYHLLWKQVDKVHSISNYLLEKAYGLGLSKEVPYSIITPAVNFGNLSPSEYKELNSPVKIVTIARLAWIKGVDTAIAAMKILEEKGIDFEYHIIGEGTTKDIERYKFQVYELGLTNKIFFQGKLSHIETLNLLTGVDLYLQPSVNEGFCNALLEAQALGKLCIASDVGGIPENIEDKETGWLVPQGDSVSFASKIREIINLPENEKQKISKNAKERVKQNFTIKKQQQEFIKFYNE